MRSSRDLEVTGKWTQSVTKPGEGGRKGKRIAMICQSDRASSPRLEWGLNCLHVGSPRLLYLLPGCGSATAGQHGADTAERMASC